MDLKNFNAALGALALTLIASVLGVIVLAVLGEPIPAVIETVIATALGGIVGMVVKTPAETETPAASTGQSVPDGDEDSRYNL